MIARDKTCRGLGCRVPAARCDLDHRVPYERGGPTSPGKAAALLSAKDPQAALTQHEQQHAKGGTQALSQVPTNIRAQLDANQKLMQQLGSSATPTIFYKDASGKLQTMQGAPSAEVLVKIMGPR